MDIQKDFIQCLRGRADFCRDRGEIKTPELLEQAANLLEAAKASVAEGFVLISKNDLKMELCSIRHLNSGEYSKSIIEECVCNIEAMIEAQEPTND